MKTILRRFLYKWYWHDGQQQWELRAFFFTRSHATVWPNGTWHTWDKDGTGGQNGVSPDWVDRSEVVPTAKRRAFEACMAQDFI